MYSMNITFSFLVWLPDIKDEEFINLLHNAYIGNVEYEGDESWGNYLYVELLNNPSERLLSLIRNNSLYRTEIHLENTILIVFNIPHKLKENVVIPILEGKYSKVDRMYVNKYFSQYRGNGAISNNWRILHKDVTLKRM